MKGAKLYSISRYYLLIAFIAGLASISYISPVKSQSEDSGRPEEYLVESTPENVIWGELFISEDEPILEVKSGDIVTVETISHEGILEDQGDTVEFFTGAGIDEADILPDQLAVKEQIEKTGEGPHVITGPIYVEGAEPGDVLEIRTLSIDYRVPYGVISNRHSKGALPDEYPVDDADIYTKVILIDEKKDVGIFRPSNGKPEIDLPLKPFMWSSLWL